MAILFSREPTGSVGLGLFLIALIPFALSIFLTHFGLSLAAGTLTAVFLIWRRRPEIPHIDPRLVDEPPRDRP
jgi:hypothetical protein